MDLLIAFLATLWVHFAFVASGWMVSLFPDQLETFCPRTLLCRGRLWDAFTDPVDPEILRDIYFGTVMGASALLPMLYHMLLALSALARSDYSRLFRGVAKGLHRNATGLGKQITNGWQTSDRRR